MGVNHLTVTKWVNAMLAHLPPASQPETAAVIEMDELYAFVERKNEVYVMTLVDRPALLMAVVLGVDRCV